MLKKITIFCTFLTFALNAYSSPNLTVPALSIEAPNGKTNLIIGSVHVGIAGLRQPEASIFEHAKLYVIEHNSFQTIDNFGSDIAPWAKKLNEKEISTYFERAKCFGIDNLFARAFLTLPTSQAANQLAYTVCGQQSVKSRDEVLSAAKPKSLPVATLEEESTIELKRQKASKLLSEDDGFKWILARDPRAILQGIKDALNNGDYDSILEQSTISLGEDAFGKENEISQYNEIMLKQRNIEWMPKLQGYLDAGDTVILVGAGHLAGQYGLINLLKQKGYQIKTTMLPEAANEGK